MFTGFKGAARRLDDIDLPRIGAEIGVGEDELHAFMDVECGGSGFDPRGRVKMLFEPHVFHRELGAGKKRAAAVKAGLAYAKWKPGGYPADSYPKLLKAMEIDETAALRSASWGLGQIMGFNCAAVGYATPQKMIEAFAADEEQQLEAVVAFLKSKGLAGALKRHDWKAIERTYNGGGYNGTYAAKMAAAFARWQKIKDTPWDPAKQDPAPHIDALLEQEPANLKEVQVQPASAAPDDRLRIRPKPVGKSRKVWSTIVGFFSGGGAMSFAAFQGWDWQSLLVIVGAILFVAIVFLLMYRNEIRAGMFAPEARK